METKIILDTTILADFLRNKESIIADIDNSRQKYEIYTTDINVFEIFYGAYLTHDVDKNLATAKGLLNTLNIFNTDSKSMELAGKLAADLDKKGQKIEFRDILIAGICLTNNCPIVTSNKKDFERLGVEIKEI